MSLNRFILLTIFIHFSGGVDVIAPNFIRSRYSKRGSTTALPIEINESMVSAEIQIESAEIDEIKQITPTSNQNSTTNSPSIISEEILSSTIPSTSTTTSTQAPITSTENPEILPEPPKLNTICGEKIGEDYPWIAVLEHTDPMGGSKKKSVSKGVLIDSKHVLTTVSSIHNSLPFWTVSSVRLGDFPTKRSDSTNWSKEDIIRVGVKQIFLHEQKDIAIIKLSDEIQFTSFIRPVCLPTDDNYNFRELDLHICQRVTSESPLKKRTVFSVPVTPLSPQDCSIMFERKQILFTLDEFCAWDERGDTCTGDLGGPLVGLLNGRYHVIGLNSYVHSNIDFEANDYPGVYARVGSHLKWINAILNFPNK